MFCKYFIAWTGEEEDQDENHIWQDDWDDDTVEDDFSNQLRCRQDSNPFCNTFLHGVIIF